MKIYTYIRMNIVTGEILEEESFEYSGAVAWCGEDDGSNPSDSPAGGGPGVGMSGGFGQGLGDFGGGFGSGGGMVDAFGRGIGTTFGSDPAGLAGMFSGSPLGQDFGAGFFDQGGGYDTNTAVSATMQALSGVLPGNFDPITMANALSIATKAAMAGQTVEEAMAAMNAANIFSSPMQYGQMSKALKSEYAGIGNYAGSIFGGLLGMLSPVPSGTVIGAKLGGNLNPDITMSPADPTAVSPTDASGSGVDSGGAEGGSGVGSENVVTGGGGVSPITGGSYQDILAQIAMDMYNKTDPARQNIIGRGMNFLEGGLDVTQSPMWGSGKNAAETQYRLARDATMANLPGGGALQSSLATGETSKARTLTDLAASIGMDEYNKIYGLATGTPQQSMSGLGAAAGANATLAGQQVYQNVQKDAQKNQLYGDMGSGIGEAIGGKE